MTYRNKKKKKKSTTETNKEEDHNLEARNTSIDQTLNRTTTNLKKDPNPNSIMAEINLLEVNNSDLPVNIKDILEAKVKMPDSNL